ncbi:MAG: hypothetical protein A2Z57_02290 [Planctomycetes bacterium RIFCSPHIGHO2_12_39_6]|nr:MAG: hypothetical protein A2Z57_02290 [Planctomycetes bacterium RIFCSPHIGHO2_12_39_6]
MNNKHIEWRKKKLEEIRQQIESGQLNALRELLPNDEIYRICQECQYDFRTRLLTPLVTIFHVLSAAISRDASFQSAWHLSGQHGQSGALSKARKRLPLEVWNELDEWIKNRIDDESSDHYLWRGHRMIGVDGTCVSMSDEVELTERFERCNTMHGYSRFPVARVGLAFNLKTLVAISHETGSYTTSENELIRRSFGRFKSGDVLILDRRFAGANLYVEYQRAGVDFICRAHQKLRIEKLKVIQRFGKNDILVEMPLSPQYLKKDPTLLKFILVRIIKTEIKTRGKKSVLWLVTSLVDPKQYPAQEICEWYKKRWKVESLIEELKLWLGADVLRSKSTEGINKELQARIIALNLIHWLILKAAKKHQRPIEHISVSAALRLATAYSLKMSTAPGWQLPLLYNDLLLHIAHSVVPYRPDRIEPRMIKREPKDYSMLKISRDEWRTIYAAAA